MQSKVKSMREANGWSQEQLAEMAGLSTRTIQRLEHGQRVGLESWKSLAAVFETTIRDLQGDDEMNRHDALSHNEESKALQEVRRLRGWYIHVLNYVMVMILLLVVNWLSSPGDWWVVWPALGWGIGLAAHGLRVFSPLQIFGDEWERRQVEKRIGRKL